MTKSEKLIVELAVNKATARLRGYNDAIDDCEAGLREEASVEKVRKILIMCAKPTQLI